MSYTPTNWSTGDTITASAMNKIENGIANASGSVFWITENTVPGYEGVFRLDKTFLEIYNAIKSKLLCIISTAYEDEPPTEYSAENRIITDVSYDQSGGGFVNCIGGAQYVCSSVNDYPEYMD